MEYNRFGATYQEIVSAYVGSIDTDFGGQASIESEIDMAVAEIVGEMSPKALHMLDKVEFMEVPQISGNVFTATYLPILQDLFVFQLPVYNPALNNSYTRPIPSECNLDSSYTGGCNNKKKELDYSLLFNDYTRNGSTITFGPSYDQLRNKYYLSYTVDNTRLSLPSVKTMIRDRVACVLGMQLYSKGDDTWKLVDLYCTRADKWMEMVDENWLPSEFKKFKWLNNPFTIKSGITSIRVSRS